MDEPCSALDRSRLLAIEDLIAELKRDFTIVIVTHNMQQAAASAIRRHSSTSEPTGKPGNWSRSTTPRKSSPTRARRRRRITSPAASADDLFSARCSTGREQIFLVRHLAGDPWKITRRATRPHGRRTVRRTGPAGDVHRGGDPMLPVPVHHHAEQVTVQVVHRVVVLADAGGRSGIAGDSSTSRRDPHGDATAHFGKVPVDLFRQGVLVAAARDLRHVQRASAPIRSTSATIWMEPTPSAGRRPPEPAAPAARTPPRRGRWSPRFAMVADHLFGEDEIGLQQRLSRVFHRDPRHPAHLRQLVGSASSCSWYAVRMRPDYGRPDDRR